MMITGFCNLKGGVGKTTACQNMAVALSKKGRRVAVVDMDPQSNLSAGFGLNPSPTDPQVFDLLSGAVEWNDVITAKEGVDIVPSSLSLVMAELNEEGPVNDKTALRNALSKIESDRYDYIFIDSPPQLGIFTQNVLAASDKVIVPMDGGFYSLFGLRLLDRSMEVFRERLNPELAIGGILLTNYNPRLYIARKIFEDVKKSFGDLLFENYIRQNVSLIEASSVGTSIFEYEPKSKGAENYSAVADEFLSRFEEGYVPPEPVQPEPKKPRAKKSAKKEQEPEPVPEVLEIPKSVVEAVAEAVAENAEETEPEVKPALPPMMKPVQQAKRVTLGAYEEGIKQDVLDLLPDSEKENWSRLLDSVSEISRGEIDTRSLRDDFEDSDKDRYTFYVLNDESDTLWPVMYPDQIIEPLRCVIKWDEYGSAEVFM